MSVAYLPTNWHPPISFSGARCAPVIRAIAATQCTYEIYQFWRCINDTFYLNLTRINVLILERRAYAIEHDLPADAASDHLV